jgi:hypothetical protein
MKSEERRQRATADGEPFNCCVLARIFEFRETVIDFEFLKFLIANFEIELTSFLHEKS